MKPAPKKEANEEPVAAREDTAAPSGPDEYPHEWDSPGSIEQFETRSREDIAGFEFEGYALSDAVAFE